MCLYKTSEGTDVNCFTHDRGKGIPEQRGNGRKSPFFGHCFWSFVRCSAVSKVFPDALSDPSSLYRGRHQSICASQWLSVCCTVNSGHGSPMFKLKLADDEHCCTESATATSTVTHIKTRQGGHVNWPFHRKAEEWGGVSCDGKISGILELYRSISLKMWECRLKNPYCRYAGAIST